MSLISQKADDKFGYPVDCAKNNVLTNTGTKNIAFCAEITQKAMFIFLWLQPVECGTCETKNHPSNIDGWL